VAAKDCPPPPRYLVIRITKKQGRLFAAGGEALRHRHQPARPPDGGSGLGLIRWQRVKDGTVKHRAPRVDQ
jgi:hypothetical protein